MSYPEIKSERYALGGGLNNKISRYLTGQQELIRLVNYDFSVPGALTPRPDTSQFLGTSFGPNPSGIFEQVHNSGASYVLISSLNSVVAAGASISGILLGQSWALNTGYTMTGASTRPSFANFDNSALVAGIGSTVRGSLFLRYFFSGGYFVRGTMDDPSNYYPMGGATGLSYGAGAAFASGLGYRYSFSYLNDNFRNSVATPLWARAYIANQGATTVYIPVPNFLTYGAYPAKEQGAGSTMIMFRETIGVTAALLAKPDVALTTAIFYIPLTFTGQTLVDSGTASATFLAGATTAGLYSLNEYYPFRASTNPNFNPNFIDTYNQRKLVGEPRFLAVLNNMVLYSGFTIAPSYVFWSQLGAPEWVANDNFNEVRTDNGDVVTGMMAYQNSVLVGKRQSVHEVTGTSPDTISFQQTTSQYGFLNNQSIAIWNTQLWFIDGSGKGICQYNGAQTEIISVKVEDIFKRINLTAAINTAWMLHVKQRNEVWTAIPVDGATTPNVIIVWDYVAQSWTTFEGLAPNVAAICKGSLTLPVPVMGFSNGDIRYMNATYTGAEFMTTAVRFPFVTNFGWSTTQVFRRFYLDVDPVVGMTNLFNANFYLNDSNTISLTRGITTTSHQARIDFGLPGNGMSVELIQGSTQLARVMGYTVESRFQRNV